MSMDMGPALAFLENLISISPWKRRANAICFVSNAADPKSDAEETNWIYVTPVHIMIEHTLNANESILYNR